MSAPPTETEPIVTCPGCGGRNPTGSNECDWCGRPFVSTGGRLRLTIWQVFTSVVLLLMIAAVGLLAYWNQGRPLPPVGARSSATSTLVATIVPTPIVTPRVSAGSAPTATPAVAQAQAEPTPEPTAAEPPTQEPTPVPEPQQAALIANTNGQGVWVHLQPGPQSQRARVLREGTRVLLTGNDQTVAARPWREIETEDHNLKGWVQGDFLQLQPATP